MRSAVHSALPVGITNQLAAVVFSCQNGGNIVIFVVLVFIIMCGVDDAVGSSVDGS